MADLNNLLEELEAVDHRPDHDNLDEYDNYDDIDPTKSRGTGRPSVETAVTEPLSYDDDDDINNTSGSWDSPHGGSSRRFVSIPVALQDAKRHKDEMEYYQQKQQQQRQYEGGRLEVEDEDEEGMNEEYAKLHQFWHHEKHCPEILEYDQTMVEELKVRMEERQEWIYQATSNDDDNLDGGDLAVQSVLIHLAQVDLDRMNYVLTCWMAERLAKIEAHPLHMRDKVDHLSDAEIEYLKEYGSLLHEHLHQTVLDHIPQAWQRLDEPNMIDQPDYEGYHFWLVQHPIVVDDVEQEEGSTLVAKYTAMRDFLRENKVELLL